MYKKTNPTLYFGALSTIRYDTRCYFNVRSKVGTETNN